jgi:predicted transglutaminase-like cysteine proteinase
MFRTTARAPRTLFAALCVVAVSLGCATQRAGWVARAFDYFAAPEPADPWSAKIEGWQLRETASASADPLSAPAAVSGSGEASAASPSQGDLREKYLEFRRAEKRALAHDVAEWIQREARHHYRPDGPIDHWATLEETLAANGDDCDGLELLVYHLLRDLGFADDEVYRAIVVRPSDGQHHMVTLWFEEAGDPWVIDPTGAMTSGMPRMSQLPDWRPLKVFSETQEFTARSVAATIPALQ